MSELEILLLEQNRSAIMNFHLSFLIDKRHAVGQISDEAYVNALNKMYKILSQQIQDHKDRIDIINKR